MDLLLLVRRTRANVFRRSDYLLARAPDLLLGSWSRRTMHGGESHAMKVLFLDQFSDFGGAQLCLRDVLTETLRRGWRAELMAPGDGGLIEFAVAKSIRVHRIPIGQAAKIDSSSAGVSRYATDLARTIRSVRAAAADLVYVNGPRVLPAAIASHKPVLFHAHSVPSKSYARAV